MIINNTNLATLGVAFSTAFQGGVRRVPNPLYTRIAMTVPSATASNEYGWIGQFPRIREWFGDRVVQNLATYDYLIKNRDFELTIGVKRNDIEDDNIGLYSPMFEQLGQQTMEFPDEMVWPLLKAGFGTLCYDKQYFFDTDHPVLDEAGKPTGVSNFGGGAGLPWFLLDDTQVMKPLIWQVRKNFGWVRKDAETDDNTFFRKEYLYGTDGRFNAGFGFWQMIYGSKQVLNAANYEAARVAMTTMRGDYGRPLNLKPSLLVVPPQLEGAARALLKSQLVNGGETNIWAGSAEPLPVSWLA